MEETGNKKRYFHSVCEIIKRRHLNPVGCIGLLITDMFNPEM
jgi:hypothetical protein